MKRKIAAVLTPVLLALVLFGACVANSGAESGSRPDSAEDMVLSSAPELSAPPPSGAEPEPVTDGGPPEELYEGPLPPEAFEGMEPLPPADNLNAEQTDITVKLETYEGIVKEISVTESGAKDKIISYIGGVKPANYASLGQLGGVLFHIEAVQNGVTEEFILFGITDDKGNPLVKRPQDPDRWYIAEPVFWEYINGLFPELDYTGVTFIDLWHYGENAGIALAGRGEHEADVEKIAKYLASMQAAKSEIKADVSNGDPIRISVGMFGDKEDKWYHCCDLYDKSGKCLVKYEGIKFLGKPADKMDTSGAGWFLADADFYRYLDSFIYHSDSDEPVELE